MLQATWGPDKRLPFSWPEHEAVFADYPELADDAISSPDDTSVDSKTWRTLWSIADNAEFEKAIDTLTQRGLDDTLRQEIASLNSVRTALASGDIFAVLIEPMQCEGGERYSSARFHQGLALLCQLFYIPLVYDEIQTGFHLGRSFFWHQQFELVNRDGQPWIPDVIVCAKKAQIGIVMTRLALTVESQPNLTSLLRGYIQGSLVDQYSDDIRQLEDHVRARLATLIAAHADLIGRPRCCGLAFAFDAATEELAKTLVNLRFRHGLLFYSAGKRSIRCRLSLAFRAAELDLLFQQLDRVLRDLASRHGGSMPPFGIQSSPETPSEDVPLPASYATGNATVFDFHADLICGKLRSLKGLTTTTDSDVLRLLTAQLATIDLGEESGVKVYALDAMTYPRFRDRIVRIQAEVYEPSRQTPGSDFDRVFASRHPLGIVVEKDGRIIGMAFAGSIDQFEHVGGIASDPHGHEPETVYMVDVTVAAEFRGGLGRLLKQALTRLAAARGVHWIVGRNRDRLARGMWAINLGLGSIETQYLVDSYHDNDAHRDCLYYRASTRWDTPPIRLSDGCRAPFSLADLTPEFVRANLSAATTKLTLSNFVDPEFVRNLADVIELFPPALRHAYTASSLSEAVDKIVKAIYLSRAPRRRLVAIAGHWFGDGTMLTRSLSQIGEGAFEVEVLPPVESTASADWWREFDSLVNDDVLAMFVEPLVSCQMQRVPVEHLAGIVARCRATGVPVVFQETGAMFYRYCDDSFSASGQSRLAPDGLVADLGGQMAIACLCEALFDAHPLKLISTWDGDAFSLAKFAAVARRVQSDVTAFGELVAQFDSTLRQRLERQKIERFEIRGGVGWIEAQHDVEHFPMTRNSSGRMLVCASPSEMQRFVEAET